MSELAEVHEVHFNCPGCNISFRSKISCVFHATIIVCQYCRLAFQVELKPLGNFDQLMEGEYRNAKE